MARNTFSSVSVLDVKEMHFIVKSFIYRIHLNNIEKTTSLVLIHSSSLNTQHICQAVVLSHTMLYMLHKKLILELDNFVVLIVMLCILYCTLDIRWLAF